MSSYQFRIIGLIGRLGSVEVVSTLRRLKRFLVAEGLQVILEDAIADLLPGHELQVGSRRYIGEHCDLVIVVGGDGSLLGAARALARYNVPVLGVNRGRLGFLTDISPQNLEVRIKAVLSGKFVEEKRFLLDARVSRDGEPVGHGTALNDVVLHPGRSTRMIAFELTISGQFVYSQRADGLIVATPTGSTAYALSGGGPIMHPRLEAIVIVPMFPHTLSSRPIVVDANAEISMRVLETNETYPQLSCDGQVHLSVAPGDRVSITRRLHLLRLIHPVGHNFYQTCRDKLGWASSHLR